VPTFKDIEGKEWSVDFDAFSLEDVRSEIGVDLADLSANGWHRVETHAPTVGQVLAIVCRDQYSTGPDKLTQRQFAKRVKGEAIDRGREVLLSAATDFFPPKEWLGIQSALEKRRKNQKVLTSGKEFSEIWATVGPILTAIETMPPEMKKGAMEEVEKQIKEAGGDAMDLEKLKAFASATGQDVTPSSAVTDSPESAEEPPED